MKRFVILLVVYVFVLAIFWLWNNPLGPSGSPITIDDVMFFSRCAGE